MFKKAFCQKKDTTESSLEDNFLKNKWSVREFFKTPCVAVSFIYGINGGLGMGFCWYIYSKNVKRSCDVAIGSWALLTFGYWSYCSYYRNERRRNTRALVEAWTKVEEKRNNTSREGPT